MLTKEQASSIRIIDSPYDFAEARLEGIGFLFHGIIPTPGSKRSVKAGTNIVHFARCTKLDKVADTEAKIWFRNVRSVKQHLDETFGEGRWKWCKVCEKEITQKILNEA